MEAPPAAEADGPVAAAADFSTHCGQTMRISHVARDGGTWQWNNAGSHISQHSHGPGSYTHLNEPQKKKEKDRAHKAEQRQKTEHRRQTTDHRTRTPEDRRQKGEDRRQKTEDVSQQTEARRPRTEDRGQGTEDRGRRTKMPQTQ